MTRDELKRQLLDGVILENALNLVCGQECLIYKSKFCAGDTIVYIPDVFLNELVYYRPTEDSSEVDEIIGCCYTGDDFIELCFGDVEKAEELFCYCDWQHPSSALAELEDDDEEL